MRSLDDVLRTAFLKPGTLFFPRDNAALYHHETGGFVGYVSSVDACLVIKHQRDGYLVVTNNRLGWLRVGTKDIDVRA